MLSALTPTRCFRASGSVSVEVTPGFQRELKELAPHVTSLGPKQGWDVKGVHPVSGETLTGVTG